MKCSICAIAKNENNYIREWCEYHLGIGFDSIYVFDNNDMDGEKIRDAIGDLVGVNVDTCFRGKNDRMHQSEAYTLYYKLHRNEFDWIAFIDVDEFITIVDSDIKDFLSGEKFKNADGIRLCWQCYTDNGLVRVEDGNYSVSRFTEYSDLWSTQAKTIIKGGQKHITSIGVHTTSQLKHPVNARGEACWNEGDATHTINIGPIHIWDCAYIKHYRFKTIQEFIDVKMKNWQQKNIKNKWISFEQFFKLNKKTPEKEEYIKKRKK